MCGLLLWGVAAGSEDIEVTQLLCDDQRCPDKQVTSEFFC